MSTGQLENSDLGDRRNTQSADFVSCDNQQFPMEDDDAFDFSGGRGTAAAANFAARVEEIDAGFVMHDMSAAGSQQRRP